MNDSYKELYFQDPIPKSLEDALKNYNHKLNIIIHELCSKRDFLMDLKDAEHRDNDCFDQIIKISISSIEDSIASIITVKNKDEIRDYLRHLVYEEMNQLIEQYNDIRSMYSSLSDGLISDIQDFLKGVVDE